MVLKIMIEEKDGEGQTKNINLSNNNWKSLINDNLEKKIGWEIARVIKIDDTKTIIETKNNKKGELNSLSLDWIKNSKKKKFQCW